MTVLGNMAKISTVLFKKGHRLAVCAKASSCPNYLSRRSFHAVRNSRNSGQERVGKVGLDVQWHPCAISKCSKSGQEVVSAARNGSTRAWKWTQSSDATKAHLILLSVLAVGMSPTVQEWSMSATFYIISLAICSIYIGSHRGLTASARQSLSMKQETAHMAAVTSQTGGYLWQVTEGLAAPIFASASLFGIYTILTRFPDFPLQRIFDCYFFILASIAVSDGLSISLQAVPGFRATIGSLTLPAWITDTDSASPSTSDSEASVKSLSTVSVSLAGIFGTGLGVSLAAWDLACGHTNFTLSNLVATLVAATIIEVAGLRSFRTAAVLLIGLLAYDVFWVFGSPAVLPSGDNVMLTVATSDAFNLPTRILFPRAHFDASDPTAFPFSLLGLGDIAIPGLLAALALRYDASRCVDMRSRASAAIAAIDESIDSAPEGTEFAEVGRAAADAALAAYDTIADCDDAQRLASETTGELAEGELVVSTDAVMQQRRYFQAVMVSYLLGLVAAFVANSLTNMGQPALLYLTPGTLGAVALVANRRGEIDRVWAFVDVVMPAHKRTSL